MLICGVAEGSAGSGGRQWRAGGRTLSYLRVRLIYSEWKVGCNQCSICESVKGFCDHEGETREGGGRWHVQCFGSVMEPKKSFRSSSAPSHACHSDGAARLGGVSHPMYVWLSAGISQSPVSVTDNTHHSQESARARLRAGALGSPTVRHGRKAGGWRRSGGGGSHGEPSNLSPPDKHPSRRSDIFPPDAADV